MSQTQQLRDIISTLEDNLQHLNAKNATQQELCGEYVALFDKFCKNAHQLAGKITDHANKLESRNSDTTGYIFRVLGQSMARVATITKDIATRGRNQVIDPLKVFTENCAAQNKTFLAKLRDRMGELSDRYSEMARNKDSYVASSERMEKNKKNQGKLMLKIENGDMAELDKFNSNIRRMTEGIKISGEQYAHSVDNVNVTLENVKKQLEEIATSLAYNQQSRLAFTKKTLICCIKNLKPYTQEGPQFESRFEAQLQKIQASSNQSILTNSLNAKIKSFLSSPSKQEYESYEQMQRRKRKKQLEEQNRHLTQIFVKVKQEDKNIIKSIVKTWFHPPSELRRKSSDSSTDKPSVDSNQGWAQCREKIINVLPYSYYFIETIYEEVVEMSSIHCKLGEDNFMLLLQLFSKIISNLKLNESGSTYSISIEFLYRMIHISMRVVWKKSKPSARGQPIEQLCQYIGRMSPELKKENIFVKLNSFLERKKLQKKGAPAMESPKGMMDSFMKGMQEAMNIKKEIKLTDEQQFGCLTELTYMMANLLTPNEVAIPVIKRLLGKGENEKSFEYLKSILFDKKDQQERQKIFFRTEVKGKMEAKLNHIIATKKQAEYCLKLTAKLGFLNKCDINLRLACRQLSNIHRPILYNLKMTPQQKWLHLIPHNSDLNYQQMKQQAIKQGLSHSVEQIIILDVNRSLHNHTDTLTQQTLRCLLRVYAYYNKDIGYCQGMNYIAGYLYLKSSSEESGYRLFDYLMQCRFKQLFANEFQVLKVKLYQFDRLLSIFHPDISDHFKKQGITSECYIVAWIITVFASSYQYTQQSYLIDLLWQRFIIWGWREFFRFVLALFDSCKEQLIELTYDRAMHFLGGLAKSELLKASKQQFMDMPQSKNMEAMIEQYEISQELLESFEKEYQFKEYK